MILKKFTYQFEKKLTTYPIKNCKSRS